MTIPLITSKAAAKALGVPYRTFQYWVAAGIIHGFPLGKPSGKGSRLRFKFLDLLAFALARHARSKGFSVDRAAAIAEWLLNQDMDSLRKQWDAGRNLLLAIGPSLFPVLMSPVDIFESPLIDIREAIQTDSPVAVIDVKAAHDQLLARLQPEGEPCLN